MPKRRAALIAAAALAVAALAFVVVYAPRLFRSAPPAQPGDTSAPGPPAAAERKITAQLYYIGEDGMALVGVQREVPFAEGVMEQARRILDAQLEAPPAPYASAIPRGTTLRALFVTERGDAFVDLTPHARTGHHGGALDELFTVYTIVNALTVNLPAITRVQILVDGREVDTLAGHVDLRHPLQKNLQWVKTDKDES
jgi:hypothetical protein